MGEGMIDCPICGREMGPGLTKHVRRESWTRQQIWLVRKMRARGISQKAIARIFGVHHSSIAKLEYGLRRRVP